MCFFFWGGADETFFVVYEKLEILQHKYKGQKEYQHVKLKKTTVHLLPLIVMYFIFNTYIHCPPCLMRFETDLLMAPTRSGQAPCSLLLNFYPFFGILNFLILKTKKLTKSPRQTCKPFCT